MSNEMAILKPHRREGSYLARSVRAPRGATKGIRFIDGKEFMLSGRYSSKPRAEYVAEAHGRDWELVKVLKNPHRFGNWSVWVHGRKAVSETVGGSGCNIPACPGNEPRRPLA